ncbi:uncharacterized protein B0I36DRAFT_160514 [Microdochium trichocladiopsis]|uniref:Uncharacterized protein n=1 Tax=Microdochium trichocladiopsis TaxID=1682393 RepID=A0A9P8Y0R5_9PEZI|nr:uncharacterized protein B0I36DRAFT_160514 [Microdochium trichocladiopsis]KAH7026598.1 hypothetical protein B0I36DRAFT_160514 [Microdochium trichocladiopsis]
MDSAPLTSKDFSFLLKPEIYHQISPLSIPAPFRTPSRQPAPETPIPDLLAQGHFRAAAIAAVQALTSSPVSITQAAAHPPVEPTDHARVFSLLYTRLSCLCLIDAVALAAQEAKALEDLNSAFYLDPLTGAHLVPWELRLLAVRLQTLGFGDPRRAVVSYYELARDARLEIGKAVKARDHSAAELWRERLANLGVKVAGALVEQEDLLGAAEHLKTLKDGAGRGAQRLAMSKALLWLHIGDVEQARRCIVPSAAGIGKGEASVAERVLEALADMADGEYDHALQAWTELKQDLDNDSREAAGETNGGNSGASDEMIGVNLAVCLLYVGRMEEVSPYVTAVLLSGAQHHPQQPMGGVTLSPCSTRRGSCHVKCQSNYGTNPLFLGRAGKSSSLWSPKATTPRTRSSST